jgi:hypothetical protein
MSYRKIQPDILLFAPYRDLSIVNFHVFLGTFFPKIPVSERSEYIDLEGTRVVYNVIHK